MCAVLNSETWENILNHILPVAKEELHASFYGNILKNFSRGLKVGVSGKGEYCEVTVSHGLVCRSVLYLKITVFFLEKNL